LKHPLHRILALTLSLVLLAGCGQQTQTPAPVTDPLPSEEETPTETPQVLSYGLAYDPAYGVNPYTTVSQTNRVFLPLCYESLFAVTDQFTAEALLAASYSVSDDQRTWTITLRSGVLFSDGTALTAADAVSSLQAAMTSSYYSARLDLISSVSAVDDTTLTITLSEACCSLPLLLDVPIVKSGTAGTEIPVGTGEFVLSTQDSVLRPNAHWWRTDSRFGGSEITLVAASDAQAIRESFELGDITLACVDPNAVGAAVYHSDYELWDGPTTVMEYLGFNPQRNLFSSAALRSAVTWCIDRTTLAQSTYGSFALAASLPASPRSPFYDTALAEQFDYDPTQAQQTLSAALPDDASGIFLVCSDDSNRVAVAQSLLETLNSYGFSLELKAVPQSQYLQILQAGSYDIYFGQTRLTANFDLTPFFSGALSYGGIGTEELANLCAAALENEGNYYDLHKAVMEQGMLCPILFRSYAVYTTRGAFTDLTPAAGNVLYHTLSE
jgi:peptide/nickel transport system substrate-binding protein